MKKQGKVKAVLVAIILLWAFAIFLLFFAVSGSGEALPFALSERTEYDLGHNDVYVEITDLLGKDQSVNISHIYAKHGLTERIGYEATLINQSYIKDDYGWANVSLGKYSKRTQFDVIVGNESNQTAITIVQYNSSDGGLLCEARMANATETLETCDYILPDKSVIKRVWQAVGQHTEYDYLPLPEIKQKVEIGGLNIEQKQDGIPLPKGGKVQLKFRVKHPIIWGNDKVPYEINKYNISACSQYGCALLDPTWWNSSFMKCRKIVNTSAFTAAETEFTFNNSGIPYADFMADFVDIRITNGTDCSADGGSEVYFWRHPVCNQSDTAANCTLYINLSTSAFLMYYNATGVGDASNGWTTFRAFDDFNRANTYNLGANWTESGDEDEAQNFWSIVSNQAYYNKSTGQGLAFMKTSAFALPLIIEMEINITSTGSDANYGPSAGPMYRNDTLNDLLQGCVNNGTQTSYTSFYNGPWNTTTGGGGVKRNTAYNAKVTFVNQGTATIVTLYSGLFPSLPSTQMISRIYPAALAPANAGMRAYSGKFYVDNFRARLYVASPASWSIGAEETGVTNAAPNVSLSFPVNASWNASSPMSFGFVPTDDSGYKNCSLWITNSTNGNFSLNASNSSAVVNGSTNVISLNLSDGNYTWNVQCCDNATSPLCNMSVANFTFAVDTTPPISNSPADATHYVNRVRYVGWVLQDNLGTGSYTAYRNGSVWVSTAAWANNTNLGVLIATNTSNIGVWNYTIIFNDTAGNANRDEVIITVAYETPGGGGGPGGGWPSTGCGAYTIYQPGFFGFAPEGERITPFALGIMNHEKPQVYTILFSDELMDYCVILNQSDEPTPANYQCDILFQCTAPAGTATGKIDIMTDTGCLDTRPVTITGATGFLAESWILLQKILSLDLSGMMAVTTDVFGLAVPTVFIWVMIIVVIMILAMLFL